MLVSKTIGIYICMSNTKILLAKSSTELNKKTVMENRRDEVLKQEAVPSI